MAAPFAFPVQEEIGQQLEQLLAGTGLRFGVVLWVPGRPDDTDAVSLIAAPADRDQVVTAFRTAGDIADLIRQPGGQA